MDSQPVQPAAEPVAAFAERLARYRPDDPGATLALARRLLGDWCVHLPEWQRAGRDPLGRLDAADAAARTETGDVLAFHARLLAIFTELGDRHTSCLVPAPLDAYIAFLPFTLVEVAEHGQPAFVVSGSRVEGLARGDLITAWNGQPVDEIVAAHGAWQYGANAPARQAKAMQTLTVRPLSLLPLPAETDVTLTCMSAARGTSDQITVPWQVTELARFQPVGPVPQHVGQGLIDSRVVTTSRGEHGYIRIPSFQAKPAELVAAVARALRSLPDRGVIVDLRGCEDGVVPAGERLLQLFTGQRIRPLEFQLRLTEPAVALVRTSAALAAWRGAVDDAVKHGEPYSRPLPLTDAAEANDIGRIYSGPVVVLTDALTYSTAEMFAAGVQAHAIGPVLGVAPCTGGGGASAWSQELLARLCGDRALAPAPGRPRFRVAVRRCVPLPGRPALEGNGVLADVVHPLTRRDCLDADQDLLEAAALALDGG